ncbi:MAG TPA: PilZ domain-containing protein [Terriglobales bacterium]|nr:PilZ domain-containing protein [Terriglobales bacterium]
MAVEVHQAEKRATRRFALRLPVEINYPGTAGTAFPAHTRDVSARGICFYLDAPMTTGSAIEFTLTLPPEITLTESIRVRCRGKVVRVDQGIGDSKIPVAAIIDEYEFLSDSQPPHIREAGW